VFGGVGGIIWIRRFVMKENFKKIGIGIAMIIGFLIIFGSRFSLLLADIGIWKKILSLFNLG
jgi:hypothetical protein